MLNYERETTKKALAWMKDRLSDDIATAQEELKVRIAAMQWLTKQEAKMRRASHPEKQP